MNNEKLVNPEVPPAPIREPAKGLALASFLCGLGSIVLCAVPAGILGIIFSRMAKKRGNFSKMVPAGLICGIIGIVLSVVWTAILTVSILDNMIPKTYQFRKFANGYAVSAGDGELPADLVIPESYLGKPVVYIYGGFEGREEIVSVTIPGSMAAVSPSAFEDCSSLERVVISEGVKEITWGAFEGCVCLTEIELPASLEKIDTNAFAGCQSLSTVRYHGTVREWEENAKKSISWTYETNSSAIHIICEDGTITWTRD